MGETLLLILEHGLSIWDTKEGRAIYSDFKSNKKKRDEQMDKRAKGLKYSQLAIDRSMRNIDDISKAYYQFIKSDGK